LLGIVTSGKLRASEASSLNDLAEITLGWRAIRRWLARQAKSEATKHLSQPRRDPQHHVFVLSGTTAGDDANQWRLYGDRGRGYAIGLDGSVPLGVVSLDPSASAMKPTPIGRVSEWVNVVPWHDVIYEADPLNEAMAALLSFTERELLRIEGIADPDSQEHADDLLYQQTQGEMERIAHLFKAGGFIGEKEVRVVARFMWFGSHVGYRAGAYGIAGHVHLVATDVSGAHRVVPEPDMSKMHEVTFEHPVPIRSVRLGPLVHKGNRETVKGLLSAYGLYAASVVASQVPLR
jgi:hypothetical protein